MRIGKRETLAKALKAIGITRLVESLPSQKILIVLNYHRIGKAGESPHDPGVFSATADDLKWQVDYLKRRFHLVSLSEALAMVCGESPFRPSVLITFDDGYLDNYTLAYPILRSRDVQAVFFLTTSFVGTNHLPWWDLIASIVKSSRNPIIRLQYPEHVEFDIRRDGVDSVIGRILQLYKNPAVTLQERFISDLKAACDSSGSSPNGERCFMNWQEAREMLQGGMALGSHTHTHEILSKLPAERQREEARLSRETLEAETAHRIDTLAYPVGGRNSFTRETVDAVKSSGYRAAFSFYGGFNRAGTTQPFNIRRVAVEPQSRERFRLRMALAAVTGRHWF